MFPKRQYLSAISHNEQSENVFHERQKRVVNLSITTNTNFLSTALSIDRNEAFL